MFLQPPRSAQLMGLKLALRPLSNAGARQVEDLRSQLHIQSISRILPISNTPAAVLAFLLHYILLPFFKINTNPTGIRSTCRQTI